jgi:hypothetical protein
MINELVMGSPPLIGALLRADGGRCTGHAASRIGDEASRIGDEASRIGDEASRIGDGVSRIGDGVSRFGDGTFRLGVLGYLAHPFRSLFQMSPPCAAHGVVRLLLGYVVRGARLPALDQTQERTRRGRRRLAEEREMLAQRTVRGWRRHGRGRARAA